MSEREQKLEKVLRSIITDVNEMRNAQGDEWFGPFVVEGRLIEWPNLDILIKEAEEVLHGG